MAGPLHYDWGLRSIRTVLTECGRTLKKFKLKNNNFDVSKETDIVLQVLRNDTLPKLSYIDSLKFNAILQDVFGRANVQNIDVDPITRHIEESFEELGLMINDRQVRMKMKNVSINENKINLQVTKCIEFYSQLRRRMGVAIVGPPRTGKTTIRTIVYNVSNFF